MQSLCKVIKGPEVDVEGDKVIKTQYIPIKPDEKEKKEDSSIIEKYNNLSKAIIGNAKLNAKRIIEEAEYKSESIQKEAYDSAYDKGYNDGYEQGYECGMNESLKKGEEQSKQIIDNANSILYNAQKTYEEFFKKKEAEILDAVCNIASNYLKNEVKNEDSILNMINEELNKIRNSKTILIKFNPFYLDEMEKNIDSFKTSLGYTQNIFLLPDESMELGEVLIEKDNGKCSMRIEYAIEKIREEIFSIV